MGRAQRKGTSLPVPPSRRMDAQFKATLGVKRGVAVEESVRRYDRHYQAYVWTLPNGSYHRLYGPAVEFRGGASKGETLWFREGLLHREGGPAVERADGSRSWYQEGVMRRDDGPALEANDGSELWVKGGHLHREGGPAVVRSVDYGSESPFVDLGPVGHNGAPREDVQWVALKGREEWRINGLLHREDGPALTTFKGTKAWYLHGHLHRTDGPAMEISETEALSFDEGILEREGRERNSHEWWLNGELHRENGPAVYDNKGECLEWWYHGKLHREDGPARVFIQNDETVDEEWYEHGQQIDPPTG